MDLEKEINDLIKEPKETRDKHGVTHIVGCEFRVSKEEYDRVMKEARKVNDEYYEKENNKKERK